MVEAIMLRTEFRHHLRSRCTIKKFNKLHQRNASSLEKSEILKVFAHYFTVKVEHAFPFTESTGCSKPITYLKHVVTGELK